MGNKQSISQDFDMKTLNKQVYKNLTKNSSKSSASGTNVQKLNIKVDINDGCPIKTNQKISSKVISSTKNMPTTIVEMKGEIANNLKQAADAKLKTVSGALSTNFGGSTKMNQKINQSIQNVVDKTITTENMSESIASSVNIQGSNLEIGLLRCRDGKGGIDMSQDITSELAANAVTEALTKNLMQDKFINKVSQAGKGEVVVENRGPLESAGAMISGIFGAMTYLYAIIGCIVCVAIGAVLYLMLSPAGQGAITTAADTGSAIVKAKTMTF